MYTSEIEIGDLVEVIRTGDIICVLEFSSDSIYNIKGSVEKSVELGRFLGEDGKVYSVNEVRVLPANYF